MTVDQVIHCCVSANPRYPVPDMPLVRGTNSWHGQVLGKLIKGKCLHGL